MCGLWPRQPVAGRYLAPSQRGSAICIEEQRPHGSERVTSPTLPPIGWRVSQAQHLPGTFTRLLRGRGAQGRGFRREQLQLFWQRIQCTGISACSPCSKPTGQVGKLRHREIKFFVAVGNWQSWNINRGLGSGPLHVPGTPGHALVLISSAHRPLLPGHCSPLQALGNSEGWNGSVPGCLGAVAVLVSTFPSPSAKGGLLTRSLGGCRVAEGLFPQWPLSEPINVYFRLINNSGWRLSREEGNLCAHSQGRLRQEPGELFVQMEQQGGSDS